MKNIVKKINFKYFIPLIFIFNLDFPINSLIDFIVFSLFMIFILSIKNFEIKNIFITFIVFLSIINFSFFKQEKIQEAHSIFLFENDIKIIENFLPKNIIKDIRNDMKNYDYDRYFRANGQKLTQAKLNKNIINKPYNFSVDSLFQNNDYSRVVYKINSKKRADFRIGSFNENTYRVPYDQKLKENMPFYVLFELNSKHFNSTICGEGKIYYLFSNNKINKNFKFNKLSNKTKCINLNKNYKYVYILGYSINEKDNLKLKLEKNSKYKIYYFLKYLLIILIFYITFFKLFRIKFNDKFLILLISFFSTIIIVLINDSNSLLGLRHLYAGADGQVFNEIANNIIEHIYNKDYLMALRGGNDIFYFMPGLRYFLSFFKMIFGETNYGYIFVTSFLPYFIYLLFKRLTNKRLAIILFILFIFIPIFERIGFGHFNYVRQCVRLHAETLAILLIISSIYLIINLEKIEEKNLIGKLIFIGLSLGFASFLRPNFLPTSILLSIYTFLFLYLENKKIYIMIYLLAFISFFLGLIHNIYFGNKFILFTDSSIHFATNFHLTMTSYIDSNFYEIIIKQLKDWNKLIYFPRLLILIYVIYYGFKYNKNSIIFFLLMCCFSQHIVLLLTHAGSRYAYLAWLITFILFIKISFDNNLYSKLKNYLNIKNI